MSIASEAKALVAEFEKENPDYKGKAYLTSGDRTWEEQLDIILDPKRKNNYLNIKKRFLKEFDLKELPEEDRGRYNTLAGMIMLLLGRLPEEADSVEWEGWRFEVVDLDGKRVDKVLASALAAEPVSPAGAGAGA